MPTPRALALAARDAEICALYSRGDLVKDIAARYKLTPSRISQIVSKSETTELRCPQNAAKNIDVAAVIADHQAGMRRGAIAAKHGAISSSTITYHLRAAGLITPKAKTAALAA